MGKVYNYQGGYILGGYIVPEEYGAVGDGITDDTTAIQSAVNNKGLIIFAPGKTYKVTSTIRLKSDTVLDLNGSTIVCTVAHLFFNFIDTDVFTEYNGNGNITIKNGTIVGGNISFGHGKNIRLENISFKDCLNDHWIEIAGCKNYYIEACKFGGIKEQEQSRDIVEYINFDPCVRSAFPWLPVGSAFYDGTKNSNVVVNNCKFSPGEGDYAFSYVAIGTHGVDTPTTSHVKIVFTNNEVIGFTKYGIHIINMNDVYIADNRIETIGDCIKIGDINPPTCDGIIIVNNYLVSQNGEMVVATTGGYTDLTVAGNTTHGASA